MALSVSDDAVAAMEQSHNPEWVVTAFYGADQTVPSAKYPGVDRVPVTTDGRVTFDADAQTQANGDLSLAYDADADLVPQSKTDPLAPYGQEVSIVRRVTYAGTTWDIPLGRYRIEEVPDAATVLRQYPVGVRAQQQQVQGWSAKLNITDLFDLIQADDFLAVKSPKSTSTWDEIQSLSPLPIVRSLPDVTIPSGITYRGRADAITQLMGNLGGEPHLTRQGALTARRQNNWLLATEPVAVVKGTVEVSGGMSNNLKNVVYVTNPSDATILGHWEISDPTDPLNVNGPLRRRTAEISDPLMDTQAKADKAAETAGKRLSTQQSRVVKVTCLPRPDLELGDFIQVNEYSGDQIAAVWLGEVRHMEFSMDPLAPMTIELTVAEKR